MVERCVVALIKGNLKHVQEVVTAENVNNTTHLGQTAIHLACRGKQPHVVEWLIHVGANVNARNNYGRTPLYMAYAESSLECMQLLLKAGADASITDLQGRVPLHIPRNSPEQLTLLLNAYPGGVHVVDMDGNIPLHFASKHGWLDTCSFLLKAGSKVDLMDQNGHTPLYYALDEEYRGMIELLIEHGARLEHVRMPFVVIPSWVHEFVAHREACRSTSYAILQLARRRSRVIGGNRKDVLGIIARMTWESRHNRSWEPKLKMKRVNLF